MAYDNRLAERIRSVLADDPSVEERKMFGGLCFMIRGNMCCGVDKDRFIARVGPHAYEKALRRAHAIPFDITKRPMKGFLIVKPEGVRTKRSVESWVRLCKDFVNTLPEK